MGLLDDLVNDPHRAPPWGRIAATFIGGVQAAQQVNGSRLMDQLMQWGSHLARNASARWAGAALRPVFCDHPGCDGQALVQCAACNRMHCLGHVLVSHHAEGICERCARQIVDVHVRRRAAGAAAASRKEALESDTVKDALRTLRLPSDATWDDVRTAYKKLAIKYNADKPMPDKKRRENEERLKKINAAYALLRDLHEKEAA